MKRLNRSQVMRSQEHYHFYLNLFLTDTRSVFQEIQENSTWCSSSTTVLQKETERYSIYSSLTVFFHPLPPLQYKLPVPGTQ